MQLNTDQLKKLRGGSRSTWRMDIIEYLKSNQGVDKIVLFDATRPDKIDEPVNKKKHNIASQFTYMRDDGYIVKKEDGKCFLLTTPGSKKGTYDVVKGMEEKVEALL